MSPTISPGWACRPSAFFEKRSFPSSDTSNTPPPDAVRLTFASDQLSRNAAARLTARGS